MRENLRGKHVLLAEDNDLNAESAVTILEEGKLTVRKADCECPLYWIIKRE